MGPTQNTLFLSVTVVRKEGHNRVILDTLGLYHFREFVNIQEIERSNVECGLLFCFSGFSSRHMYEHASVIRI